MEDGLPNGFSKVRKLMFQAEKRRKKMKKLITLTMLMAMVVMAAPGVSVADLYTEAPTEDTHSREASASGNYGTSSSMYAGLAWGKKSRSYY